MLCQKGLVRLLMAVMGRKGELATLMRPLPLRSAKQPFTYSDLQCDLSSLSAITDLPRLRVRCFVQEHCTFEVHDGFEVLYRTLIR